MVGAATEKSASASWARGAVQTAGDLDRLARWSASTRPCASAPSSPTVVATMSLRKPKRCSIGLREVHAVEAVEAELFEEHGGLLLVRR